MWHSRQRQQITGSAKSNAEGVNQIPAQGWFNPGLEPERNQRCKRWQCAGRTSERFQRCKHELLGPKVLASSNLDVMKQRLLRES